MHSTLPRGFSGSYTNPDEISSSEFRPSVIYKISTKYQPENTDQTSESKACLNFNFKIFIKLQNTDQTSASKLAFKLQNLDKTLCSKSEQKFNFITKPQLPNLLYLLLMWTYWQKITYGPTLFFNGNEGEMNVTRDREVNFFENFWFSGIENCE